MKFTKKRLASSTSILRLAALTLLVSPLVGPLATAQEATWYGGLSAGKTKTDMDSEAIVPRLQQFGLTTTSIDADDKDAGFKLFTGYRFNKNFAVEGSYFDLGKFGFRAVMPPSSNLAGNIRLMGFGLDLVGSLPITDNGALFARAGINYTDVRESFSARNLANHPYAKNSEKNTNYKYGVGYEHNFTDALAMRAEVERYRIDEPVGLMDKVDMFSVGVVYRFGAKPVAAAPRPAAAVAAATPPRAPTPTPPVAAPAPAVPVKISLSADSLFDFDSASLKPAGKGELDKLVTDLRALKYDVITVTGHSDRIGAERYNLELSKRRAQMVKDYLVSVGKISTNVITAVGVDGSSPVTRADQCNNLARAALITCLQPDRRVEVEVVGTK
jgi:OmpA-OmpF porin, OOP family